VDYIVCNSKGTESEYKKAGFKRTVAVPNGVDLEKFKVESRKSKVDETKEKLNLPLDKKIIMYTGHLYAWKGVDTVIEAAKLCSNYSQIIFVFVGGTEKDLLKYQKIKESQSLTNVLFVGHREQKEVPEYLACADVLLLPNVPLSVESEHYTSPIKMFEYMASGKPVVASDLPSIREVLNEKNSILVKPADATDLIRGINEALENPIHTREITREALMNVENYTWIKRAERIISYLNQ
jgi:glycosyltransferase involved in cell wall biosynthesis